MSDRHSIATLASGAFAFAGMFAYITASPFVYIEHFGVAPEHYGYLFGLNICAIVLVSLLNTRLLRSFKPEGILLAASAMAAVAGGGLMAATLADAGGLALLVALLFVYVGMIGAIGANCVALLIARHPENAGSATAAFGVAQFGLGSVASAAAGLFEGPLALGVTVGVCAMLGLLALGFARWPQGACAETASLFASETVARP